MVRPINNAQLECKEKFSTSYLDASERVVLSLANTSSGPGIGRIFDSFEEAYSTSHHPILSSHCPT